MNWLKVAKLSDIPKQGARVVKTADGAIALFRTSDDRLFAVENSCPHRRGPLSEGIVYGHRVTCPLHEWVIELDSGEAAFPDKGCVKSYAVEKRGEDVYLNVVEQAVSPHCQ